MLIEYSIKFITNIEVSMDKNIKRISRNLSKNENILQNFTYIKELPLNSAMKLKCCRSYE